MSSATPRPSLTTILSSLHVKHACSRSRSPMHSTPPCTATSLPRHRLPKQDRMPSYFLAAASSMNDTHSFGLAQQRREPSSSTWPLL
jgi:hypothetical protein